ncbi:manganese efflux pump [Pyxidicoccus fallax]|uniref:Putative manganese efflux pump MntP n=1 Tax=Pyxidicoccus fallax TaxID=394095 RepID=A0A848L8M5_9BACT|nr:manganese efflux pump MntP family protein [Pyxidicoccus fallax]NMO14602.1 manganese efflux pump [Pyxidicoccus fallax]NPC77366.1 manganese efflux pump [Pyxidicoccus fallax]
MAMLDLLLLALGLSMDATAVSVASSLAAPRVRARDALLLSFLFGLFQAVMPVIGWAVGAQFAAAIADWDHWLAFVLLGGIGAKMLHEAYTHRHPGTDAADKEDARKANEAPGERDPFHLGRLVIMAFATSIDALAAGVTLPVLDVHIATAAAIIGGITFALCLLGVSVGRRFGDALEGKLDIVGGLVLIGLGVKTLVEHLSAG